MWYCVVAIFMIVGLAQTQGGSIPSYIKPCSKNKDFNSCAVKNGNEALPMLLKGDKTFKIPNLLPLKFPKVDVISGGSLKIGLTNIELYGLETVVLKEVKLDFQKQQAYLNLYAERVMLLGTYDVDGKIMVLPVTGHGPLNLTAEACDFKYTFNYKLEKKNDVEYAIIQDDDKLEYTIGKAHFDLQNLFNGNQAMGDNVNRFLNENDQDVLKELGTVIEETIRAVVKNVGGGILSNVPYHDLFLD